MRYKGDLMPRKILAAERLMGNGGIYFKQLEVRQQAAQLFLGKIMINDPGLPPEGVRLHRYAAIAHVPLPKAWTKSLPPGLRIRRISFTASRRSALSKCCSTS